MRTLLSFTLGFLLAAGIAVVAVYRTGGDLQFKMRVAQDITSRRAEEVSTVGDGTDAVPDESLMSGQAWRDFCDLLAKAGEQILRDDVPDDPRTRAQGYEYLSGLLLSGLLGQMYSDPNHPQFIRIMDWHAKWGLDNSDALYLAAAVDGSGTYRISGKRETVRFLGIQASYGQFGSSTPMGVVSNLTGDDLEIAPDGSFEIIASAEPQEGNWLRMTPQVNSLGARQFFSDWENEVPAELYIERIDIPHEVPVTSTHSVASRLKSVGEFVEGSAKFWNDFVLGRRASMFNELSPTGFASDLQGSNAQSYGWSQYALAEGEALLIEVKPPEALYWNFELGDFWARSMDYVNRIISINDHQAVLDPDGMLRIVVSASDPGLANWLDTGGIPEGTMTYRYNGAKSHPSPSTRLVRLDELDQHVPANAARSTPAQRSAEIERRRRALSQRFSRG